ncbi:MAG: HAD family hydrolase [Candidatus Micrarchaeota archaeon]|nr:HAD family hydrolase [Candidatus Micrarchaeota archaeon]MDE1824402.1 HAD family hydrolase [Candidatus Micrarchaeota archaeon]MDE1849875.1 HAD family hydrolase [Candidatus Micrarchaeota archaeon]
MGSSDTKTVLSRAKAIGLDKDGVIVNDSRLLHENLRRGFAKEAGRDFPFDLRTSYQLRGVNHKYHGGTRVVRTFIAVERWAKEMGIEPNSALSAILDQANPASRLDRINFDYVKHGDNVLAERIFWYDQGRFFKSEEASNFIDINPGSREAVLGLNEIFEGRLAIISNAHSREIASRDLRRVFYDSEIKLMNVITAEDVRSPKPSPEGINAAIERFKVRVSPSEFLFVGDAVLDIQTARNAGTMAAAVLSGVGRRTHLESAKPDAVFNDIAEIAVLARK